MDDVEYAGFPGCLEHDLGLRHALPEGAVPVVEADPVGVEQRVGAAQPQTAMGRWVSALAVARLATCSRSLVYATDGIRDLRPRVKHRGPLGPMSPRASPPLSHRITGRWPMRGACAILRRRRVQGRSQPEKSILAGHDCPRRSGVLYRGPVRRMTNSTFVRRRRNDIGSLAESFRTRPRYVASALGRPRVAPSSSERLTGRR